MTTHVQQVQRIARAYGYTVDDEGADYILWNHTGFPSFFETDAPHRELRRQLRAFFREARSVNADAVIAVHLWHVDESSAS